MLNAVKDYPLQALNWHDREGDPDLANGKVLFPGAVSGGIGRMDPCTRNSGRGPLSGAQRDRADQRASFHPLDRCVIMTTTPQSNIRAAREVVEIGG
jgi:uroporphyrinogen decarboxylase